MPPFVINELSVVREICIVDLDLDQHLTIEEMALVFYIAVAKGRHRRRLLTADEIEREVVRVRALASKWCKSPPVSNDTTLMVSDDSGLDGSVH